MPTGQHHPDTTLPDPAQDAAGPSPAPEVAAATASFREAIRRTADQLAGEGAQFPDVGAAAIAARGAAGLDRQTWAETLRLPMSVVDEVEAGDHPVEHVPERLLRRLRLVAGGFDTVA